MSVDRRQADGGVAARGTLSGLFAAVYVGLELALKLLAGAVHGPALYGVYTAGAAAAITFATEAEVHAFLDAHLSSVRYFSSALGDIIQTQSLSQLMRNEEFAFGI